MAIKIIDFILTGFYSGKIKYMPGTFGTLPAIPIYIYLYNSNSLLINIIILLSFLLVSMILLRYSITNNIFKVVDDKSIVVDEIIGYLLFMIFFEPNVVNIMLGFFLFRFFDILKPFPISYVDKNIKNSFGVLFDDILAGIISGLLLYCINYVFF